MVYAEVSVNSPAAQRRTFSYRVPDNLRVAPGDAVLVPFGERELQGVVLELSPLPAVEDTREIISVTGQVLSPVQIALARWLSEYYLAPLYDALALMLPPGSVRKPLTLVSAIPAPDELLSRLAEAQQAIYHFVRKQGTSTLKELESKFGKKKAPALVAALGKRNLLSRSYHLEPPRVTARKIPFVYLTGTPADKVRLPARQAALLSFIKQAGPVSWPDATRSTGCGRPVLRALVDKGLVTVREEEAKQTAPPYYPAPAAPLPLTPAQQEALEAITASCQAPSGQPPAVFLLHGVTGSGKTEIYLQALAETVRRGRRGIMLVPEIALTPQAIERVAARFPGRTALLHSGLSPRQRFDRWQRVRQGEVDVVIGSRSALFAPQPELGLIIIDEEHEWTYKQTDPAPRYHARAAALRLAELCGATVVLGSATPDVESYHHAACGDYRLLELPERVGAGTRTALPRVEVVDMREELKAGNRGLFSRSLERAVARTLARGEQVILFLNRRGAATLVQCRHCGYIWRCPRCTVPLNYHPDAGALTCHQCNYRLPVPASCPQCRSPLLKFLGAGTQKLEKEAALAFPQARQLRWDSDVTRQDSHETLLNRFRNHEADILIGTQMIAKGLDIPSVTLVGVINADTGLNLPDFRAGERTFQLLSQVAGRAGRGAPAGQVIIQTYSPGHYAVRAAARHDYAAFYRQEIGYRQQLHNPPFSQLALLTHSRTNDAACQQEAERFKKLLAAERDARGVAGLSLIGPAPAFIHRLRGRYRWQLVLRGANLADFLAPVPLPPGWSLDIDPVSLI